MGRLYIVHVFIRYIHTCIVYIIISSLFNHVHVLKYVHIYMYMYTEQQKKRRDFKSST